MKQKLVLIASCSLVATICLLFSFVQKKNEIREIENKYAYLDALNTFSIYKQHVSISNKIKLGEEKSAQCLIDVIASYEYDEMKLCLSSEKCRIFVERESGQRLMEIFGDSPKGFNYYSRGQVCGDK